MTDISKMRVQIDTLNFAVESVAIVGVLETNEKVYLKYC